ncbi:hypothetical protein IW262DRAFT_887007 [Armillaria fumosa]|nr:hypothetical protein IW262DRAFT_887007 [Armillaria fumosa]
MHLRLLVGSVLLTFYWVEMQVQKGRHEIIRDFESMCKELIEDYCDHHRYTKGKVQTKPEQIIVYRVGVSEGDSSRRFSILVCTPCVAS